MNIFLLLLLRSQMNVRYFIIIVIIITILAAVATSFEDVSSQKNLAAWFLKGRGNVVKCQLSQFWSLSSPLTFDHLKCTDI